MIWHWSRVRPWSVAVLVLAWLASGCADSVDPASPSLDASLTDGAIDAGLIDVSRDASHDAARDAGLGASADATSGPVPAEGIIEILGLPVELTTGWAFVAFGGPAPAERPTCATSTTGPCTLIDCRQERLPDGSFGTVPSAGRIMIYQGDTQHTITLEPIDTGEYSPAESFLTLVVPGSPVHIEARGAALPAFRADVTIASPLNLTAPGPSDAGVEIDRAAGFTATWEPTGAPVSIIVIQADPSDPTNGSVDSVILRCVFDGASGTGTVPASALASFVPEERPRPSTFLAIQARGESTISVGPTTVRMAVGNGGLVTAPRIR